MPVREHLCIKNLSQGLTRFIIFNPHNNIRDRCNYNFHLQMWKLRHRRIIKLKIKWLMQKLNLLDLVVEPIYLNPVTLSESFAQEQKKYFFKPFFSFYLNSLLALLHLLILEIFILATLFL